MELWMIIAIVLVGIALFGIAKELVKLLTGISFILMILIIGAGFYLNSEADALSQRLQNEDKIFLYKSTEPVVGILLSGNNQKILGTGELDEKNGAWKFVFTNKSFEEIKTVEVEGKQLDAAPFRKALEGSPQELMLGLGAKTAGKDELLALALTMLANELLKEDVGTLLAEGKLSIEPETTTFKLLKLMPWLR